MTKVHSKIVFAAMIVLIPFVYASSQTKDIPKQKLTGNLILDSRLVAGNNIAQAPQLNLISAQEKAGHKSRWLGGLFSLILPGSGEFYAQDYLKAGIFLVVEAAAIATAAIYTHKGDFQTAFFQQYANQNWSVAKYAAWTLQHLQTLNPDLKASDYHVFKDNADWSSNNMNNNTSWSQWTQLNSDINWSELNRLELAIGDGYSHQLFPYGQQQYYEMIGKYPQFSEGWSVANMNDTDFHLGPADQALANQFNWYAHQRGLANSYYTDGNTAIIFIYINHFLSTLDAIWSVDKYNDTLAMNLRMDHLNVAGQEYMIPTVYMSYNF